MFSKLRRVLPVVIGLLLLGLFIWYAGPLFAFADRQPLASSTVRLILIGLIVLAWLASIVVKRVRANKKSDQLVAAVVNQSSSAGDRPSAEAIQLRERFEEAAATLKQKRRSGHSLYDLPWYVIIGAPGSGKTTALVNSGLHFPLEQRLGRGALRGVGGTRNCDWWFTDEAVLLDTAGRYTTQDSDASADSAGWLEFLALLRKYRKRRPLNGVIVTVSAQDLMQPVSALDPHVDAIRRRLNELNKELRIQLPVYVMVTKCDLVAGFTEYFDDLAQEGRAQVWGTTFPLETTRTGAAAAAFPAEFDALVVRLNERLFARIEEERDVRRRAKIFGFPQQLAALRETLLHVLDGVFTSTRFDQHVLLRGVYFTSGTQEGTPVDRLLGAIGRRFGVAADAVVPPGRGKAYFIERLLKEVLFAESGLAGVNRRFELQMAAAQMVVLIGVFAVTVVAVVVWSVSYKRNRNYLAAVEQDVARLQEVPPIQSGASLDAALPRLNAVRDVVQSAERYRESVPWAMRAGLFQGNSVAASARDAYARELDRGLLPHVAARFRDRLSEYSSEPERLYPYLKGYLMLGDPKHLDKEELVYLADLEWQEAFGSDQDRATVLGQHFRSLLDTTETLRPLQLDDRIVQQARNSLAQASLPGLVYRYVRINYANDTGRNLRLDLAAGLNAERVLRIKGRSLTEPVPSIYTAPVFKEITAKGTAALIEQLTGEAWVWGATGPSVTASSRLTEEFLDIYEKDYIAVWDRIYNGIQSAPSGSLTETKEALAILGAETSPLRGLLSVIDSNTYLTPPPEPEKPSTTLGLPGNLKKFLPGRSRTPGAAPPGTQVTAHFADLHRLIAGEKGSAPIDGLLEQVRQLQKQVQPLGAGVGETDPGDPRSAAAVGEAANGLRRSAAQFPPSIAGVATQVATAATAAVRGGVRNSLESRYQQDVVRQCELIVTNRYPFQKSSTKEVPLEDFGRLFGPRGLYDEFFATELADLVDTARSPWAWRRDATGAAFGGSQAMLRTVQTAREIRDLFFSKDSQGPELRFRITPVSLNREATQFTLDVDGKQVVDRHNPPRTEDMTWPGPKPELVVVNFEERGKRGANQVFNGAWAWFKFLDAVSVVPESENRYTITVTAGGHEARLALDALRLNNPYRGSPLTQFRCQ